MCTFGQPTRVCVCGCVCVCGGGGGVCGCVCVWGGCVCVWPGIQSKDQNQFFTFKVRTFSQSEVKISVLALWLCALSSLFHNMGVGGYGRNPLFVRARHVQRCVKKCPHFECESCTIPLDHTRSLCERVWSSGIVQDSGALDREFEPR